MQAFKERKHKEKEQAVYRDIQQDVSNYEDAIDLINALPFNMQVMVARYCLTNLVTMQDISSKQERVCSRRCANNAYNSTGASRTVCRESATTA